MQPNNKNIKSICEKLNVTREVLLNETACVSDNNHYDSYTDNSSWKRNNIFLIGIIVLSIIIIWLITLTIVMGLLTFMPNTDNFANNSYSVKKYIFYILLAVTLILIVVDLILLILKIKKANTNYKQIKCGKI